MKIELNRDWTEFLSALISRRVRFLLIGGHAVAGHGEPRLTEDLDVFVEPTLPNARKLREALIDFGFGSVAPSAKELAQPEKVFMLGRKPWRIDILTGISGVSFKESWTGRVEVEFARRPLYVIGREALLKNKRASGRNKDLRDVAMLEEHAPATPNDSAKSTARRAGDAGRRPARPSLEGAKENTSKRVKPRRRAT